MAFPKLRAAILIEPDIREDRPTLRPQKLYPIAASIVIAAHVLTFAAFVRFAQPNFISLGTISAELVPEGDFFEAEAISATDLPPEETKAEEARADDPEDAASPPAIPVDAPRLPAKKEINKSAEKQRLDAEKKSRERRAVEYGRERRETQARRRYGAPGGRGAAGSGASQATCLAHVAAALRRHTPGSTSLGPGSATVTFHINAGGGISVVSAAGTTPAHAALARRIVSASRGPGTCGAAFVSQNIYFD